MGARHHQLSEKQRIEALDDDALMQEIGLGNEIAGTVFIHRHLSYVLKICRAKLTNVAEAEEAAQDVFASVWKNAGHWQAGQAKVTTWLYRVTSNRCIDILRRRRPMTPIDDAPPLIDEAVDIERHQQAVDQNRLIQRALGQLSKDQQHAIELVYYRDMRQSDAAEMMGITLVALESILRRARQKLHAELATLRGQLEMI